MTPTYKRPDFIRCLVAQMALQQYLPDVLCIHQNRSPLSYEWAVSDYNDSERFKFIIDWILTPRRIPRDEWYIIPLEALLYKHWCDIIFWCDHDDYYRTDHVLNGVKILSDPSSDFDFAVNSIASLLLIKDNGYDYYDEIEFTAHALGGMSSSLCFSSDFGKELLMDLKKNNLGRIAATSHYSHSDQVIKEVTVPKFKGALSHDKSTTIYHCHAGTVSSRHWLTGTPPSLRSMISHRDKKDV
jgi:hypothetical protein